MGTRTPRRLAAVAGAAALTGALCLAGPASAVASTAPPSRAAAPAAATTGVRPAVSGDRRCVTVPSVFIRNYPAGQAWTQLYANQTFSVYEYRDSGWARGYAWGDVNTDQSPYAAPYNDVWVETSALGKHVNDGSAC